MKDKLLEKNISEEMQTSFLDYSMSVIVSRALPDIRDGLKPVHRRILYTMNSLGMYSNTQFKKSARIVGDVMGKYHPHGDSSIYEAMVRMAQPFSYRYLLVEGHGNFGSIDGDSAAAMRYTEARMGKLSMELVRDINKDTVDFVDNYDGTEKEPVTLPSRFPNILINGITGIAVGMATNIPPHNLGEVIDGTVALIDNEDISIIELMEHIKGPDFPTAGTILGKSNIKKAYETGRGIITNRAKAEITEKNNKQTIEITEIPYQVNKSALIVKIADLVKNKVIEGITDLRDESNRNGIKIVIELKREANANVILNNLYKHSSLQISYGIILLALVDGQPRILNLKEILEKYLDYQKEIITRRTRFDLDKAEKREHILLGLEIALNNIDEIIKIIKTSKNDQIAKEKLIENFKLTEIQADAILDMRLKRLTGLEREKLEEELKELKKLIQELTEILKDRKKILEIIKTELLEIKEKYSDERRTKIDLESIEYMEDESLIPEEEVIITITNNNYIKKIPMDTYKLQNKGGVGIKGMTTNEEDFVKNIIVCSTHDYIMFFTNNGKVYRKKGYEVPEYSRQAKGLPIVNLIPLEENEIVSSIFSTSEKESKKLLFVTKKGYVKKVNGEEFENIRINGKKAVTLKEDDELISVNKIKEGDFVVLASSNGRMVCFKEDEIRTMGRSAAGVKGINLDTATCIEGATAKADSEILVATEKGYGKRTDLKEYRITKRGSKGIKASNITNKTGNIIGFKIVKEDEDLILSTDFGMIIRMPINQISKLNRVTQGVKLISLKDNQKVSTVINVKE